MDPLWPRRLPSCAFLRRRRPGRVRHQGDPQRGRVGARRQGARHWRPHAPRSAEERPLRRRLHRALEGRLGRRPQARRRDDVRRGGRARAAHRCAHGDNDPTIQDVIARWLFFAGLLTAGGAALFRLFVGAVPSRLMLIAFLLVFIGVSSAVHDVSISTRFGSVMAVAAIVAASVRCSAPSRRCIRGSNSSRSSRA